MKRFGKILKMALVIIMVFSMIGCVQAPSITVPNGHVPTISENITSLAQSSNSTVKSRKYYYSVFSIAGRYKDLKRDLAIVQQYLNARASGYEQGFWKINRTEYIPLMFDNSHHLVKPAYYKALSDCAFYRDILHKKTSLVQQVKESLKLTIIPYERVSKDYKLNYYLSQNVGRKYFKDDRNELIEKINLRQDGHIKSSFKLLYQCLMEGNVDFTLKSGIDNRKVYWTIEPK